MEYDPNNNTVIHLLKKLKEANDEYPPEMLAMRRQGYIKQVAEISGTAGLAMGLKNLAKGGKGSAGASSTAGTIVEALLVVALVAEAGAVTYFYRDKIAEVFRSSTRSPKVEEVASPPILSSPIAEMPVTPSPVFTLTLTFTVTPAGTETLTPAMPSVSPSPVLAAETTGPNETGGASVQSASTSAPSSNTGGSSVSPQDPKGNNGNHYGQTPKPERTKEPGSNSDPSSSQESTSNDKKKP